MLQPRGEAHLAEKPVGADRGGDLGMECFERYRPPVAEVVRKVHARHAAPADLALYGVAAGESVGQADE
jgi:hypothetical protein